MSILEKLFKYVVLGLTGMFCILLLIQSLWSTTVVFTDGEYYTKDTPFFSLLWFLIIVTVMVAAGVASNNEKIKENKFIKTCNDIWKKQKKAIYGIILALTTGVLVWFVLSVKLTPLGDQMIICNGAAGLKKYDFSLFTPGNYYGYWPFQSRITVFLWGFFSLFGEGNYAAFQILNVLCVVLSYLMLAFIAEDPGVFLGCALFIPYGMYTTYVYGNLPGLACMLISAYFLMKYKKSGRLFYALGIIIFCGIGLWLKNSYQIIMIALIIMLIMEGIKKRNIVPGIIMVILVLVFSGAIGRISDSMVERRTGFPTSSGSPMISWITMAFGEDENGNPVRYDAYNMHIYLDNDRDTEKAHSIALEDLKERLDAIMDTPGHFIGFMGKKIGRAWNDPTFESVAVNGKGTDVKSQPELIKDILYEGEGGFVSFYDNIIHALIIMGSLLYVIYRLFGKPAEKEDEGLMFFCLSFVGGFMFLLFWETLSQYAMVYFLMLIPVAMKGYSLFSDDMVERICLKKKGEMRPVYGIIGIILFVSVSLILPFNSLKTALHPDTDEGAYTEAVIKKEAQREEIKAYLPDGRYFISPVIKPGYGISSTGERDSFDDATKAPYVALLPADNNNTGIINIHHEYNYDLLRLERTQYLLTVSGEDYQVDQDGDEATWRIIPVKSPDGSVSFAITIFEDLCLSVGEDGPEITPYTGDVSQLWNITALK